MTSIKPVFQAAKDPSAVQFSWLSYLVRKLASHLVYTWVESWSTGVKCTGYQTMQALGVLLPLVNRLCNR